MIQNVLCVIDLANPAMGGAILQRAAAIATMEQARLHVLSVAPDYGMAMWAELFEASPFKVAMDKSAEMLEAFVEQTAPGVKAARYLIAYGEAEEKISEALAGAEADLVALGDTHAEAAAALLNDESGPSVYLVRR